MSRQSGGSGGAREERGRGANRRDRRQIEAVAREKGVDRRDFGDYVEEVKSMEGRRNDENFSYEELLDLAEELKQLSPK